MTAPLLGEARPTHHRFVLGGFEVTAVLDGRSVRQGVHPTFGHDRSEADVAAYAKARHLPADRYEAVFVPTLVNTGSALVLFDTGLGAMGRGSGAGGFLRERLREAGYAPEMVDVVALTHGHPDHIGGLVEDGAPAFPNARYAIGRAEYDGWVSGAAIPPNRATSRELFLKLVPPLAERIDFLEPGDSVVPGIEAVEAHGHSVGHMAFMVESAGKSVLLWGDVANHCVFSVERPQWQVGFDDDKARAVATRERILDWAASDALAVLGFHMPFPSVGFVERAADGYRFVPETNRLAV